MVNWRVWAKLTCLGAVLFLNQLLGDEGFHAPEACEPYLRAADYVLVWLFGQLGLEVLKLGRVADAEAAIASAVGQPKE